ncbi:hypothetical protein BREVUG8_100343 [Brevundimonas sp. G8]|nr:hypothetical protein BREVUG8_100343 [Brevundimonas sp. G8]
MPGLSVRRRRLHPERLVGGQAEELAFRRCRPQRRRIRGRDLECRSRRRQGRRSSGDRPTTRRLLGERPGTHLRQLINFLQEVVSGPSKTVLVDHGERNMRMISRWGLVALALALSAPTLAEALDQECGDVARIVDRAYPNAVAQGERAVRVGNRTLTLPSASSIDPHAMVCRRWRGQPGWCWWPFRSSPRSDQTQPRAIWIS